MVISPAVFYHPHTAVLWVHLSGLQEPVQVTIELQRADGTHNITLLERKVQEPHLYLNITFPVSATPRMAISVEVDALDTLLSPGRATSTSFPHCCTALSLCSWRRMGAGAPSLGRVSSPTKAKQV